jgi:O-antigen/teichoic acid export membrane protein
MPRNPKIMACPLSCEKRQTEASPTESGIALQKSEPDRKWDQFILSFRHRMMTTRRALLIATFERYFVVAMSYFTVPVMSRLLTPSEMGEWVVAVSILTTATSVRAFASYNYLIQKNELSANDTRTAFTLMALLTIVIAAVLGISAPLFAGALHSAGLTGCLRLLAIALVVELVAAPISTLLRRDLAFGQVAAINIANATVNSIVIISFALLGFSYMSYAWGWLLGAAAASALAFYLRPHFWIFRPTMREWRAPLKFGAYYGSNSVLYQIYDSVKYLLISRLISFDAAGLYNRAITILQLSDKVLLGGVPALAIPAFSSEVREGGNLKAAYLRSIEFITVVQWPALILLIVAAYPLTYLILGSQWLGTAPIIRIIAVAFLFSFTAQLDYALLISLGAMRDNLRRALIVVPTSIVVLVGACQFDLTAVALSQTFLVPLETFVSLYFVCRRVSIQWKDLFIAVRKSAAVTACSTIGATSVVLVHFSFELSAGAGLLAVLLSAIGWAVGLWLSKHPLIGEIDKVIGMLRTDRGSPRFR